ncbi:MAG: bifunctional 5,10-methylenetetrahydrofolate dehydrogenase/5,10-methenyltetrahydrofolate cyclohydrolase [Clostridiales Family XIII bacterium]|jgi:methylenetetrahydrofolate dehydrogenase (NADP+)/methenyltetrahydrofolate cyclohydrolase|nr:bifunctional 5,10-methylenetetrahydrofolate dehydrogenase/5,10-methenyltetrahydrofolate cyclohydrolase [Clostridiales Family XIII bacterium]
MTKLLSGKEIKEKRMPELANRAASLRGEDIFPCLAIIRAGERDDDIAYEHTIIRLSESVGIDVRSLVVSEETEQAELIERIERLNADSSVHGVLIFRPLPAHVDEGTVCAALDPKKDVDGVTPASMAALYAGDCERGKAAAGVGLKAGFAPCTAEAVLDLLDHYGIETEGQRAVVVGRSAVIGRPVSLLLLERNATVTICHSRTVGIEALAASADILIVAAGLARDGRESGVGRAYFNANQTVVDVGIHADADGKLYGDVIAEDAMGAVANLTPVPGGVGTVTTLKLLSHVLIAAENGR